ncbi:MAG: hypothetical protein KAQ94_06460 [Arcobacteraceae bacterium]|nr:hypothetical protein [Arcobacteraceae bacterium]
MRLFLNTLFLCSFLYAFDAQLELENTNIITSTTSSELKDYNRLRLDTLIEDEKYENTFIKIIIDNTNNYNHKIKKNVNKTDFYRGYLKYTGEKHLFAAGLQRIPFGVGRIWNPIDIFNPIDSTSIETSERKGVESIRYEYAIGDLSNLDVTYSKRKSAFRIKGYLDVADAALVILDDDKQNQEILGYELEGELLNSGIELRSEGGYFKDTITNTDSYKYIVGGEYGFENSLTILGEYKYESKTKSRHLGSTASYQVDALLSLNLLVIKNLEDKSYILTPSINYSLDDEVTLSVGMFDYSSNKQSEFGSFDDYYFVKLFVHF